MFLPLRPLLVAPLVGAALLASGGALAQEKRSGPIYSCEVNGKRITSDRPVPECNARDQRLLNSDGSVREVKAPVMTADERAAYEAKLQDEALARAQQREAVRRDRNLLARFPNQKAHDKAREAALDIARSSLKTSEARLAALEKERKPLLDETEFYVNKTLPVKLKQAIDANDASTEEQRDLVATQKAEIVRITRNYDEELERLRRLWGGAMPGSLGPLAVAEPAASAPARPARQ